LHFLARFHSDPKVVVIHRVHSLVDSFSFVGERTQLYLLL